mmetsp:Transcript_27086/g.46701  ORF Transcript_27086/g.46701 Transcript_27086/m.46701 type:complete len:546 (+) Transcript_27086:96-1733(+)
MEAFVLTSVAIPSASALKTGAAVCSPQRSEFLGRTAVKNTFLAGNVPAAVAVSSPASFGGIDVKCEIPLIAYKPVCQNSRVKSIGLENTPEAKYATTEYRAGFELNDVIAKAYKQIWGEHQTLSNVRQESLESLFRSGQTTVKQLIKGLCLSPVFLEQNLYNNTNYRFVEKIVQRVLGRDVFGTAEKIAWSIVICSKGVEAFIDAVLNSDEYNANFGDNIVPFQRARVLAGRVTGETPFNIKTPRISIRDSFRPFPRGSVPKFQVLSQKNRADFAVTTDPIPYKVDPERMPYAVGNKATTLPLIPYAFKSQNYRVTPYGVNLIVSDLVRSDLFKGDFAEKDDIIFAAYRQIFSEHQNIKFNKQPITELKFRNGDLTVKELVKAFATSDTFLGWNYAFNSNYRFVEMMVQRLLGRDVHSEREKVAWSIVICNEGPIGFIDKLMDSEEYMSSFGDNVVPYQKSRNLPSRDIGETPFRMKTPRYDDYYRKQFNFYDWGSIAKNYTAFDKRIKAGDPRLYATLSKGVTKYPGLPKVSIPSDYLALVPRK